MRQSNALRGVCREFREALIDSQWMDAESQIKSSIEVWRAALPAVSVVNLIREDIVNSDFVHVRGDARARLHNMNMGMCSRVTNAVFVHLGGIQELYMMDCKQVTITVKAFVHLRGIHTVYIHMGLHPGDYHWRGHRSPCWNQDAPDLLLLPRRPRRCR